MIRCRAAVLVVVCGVCIGISSEASAQDSLAGAVDTRLVTAASLRQEAQAPDPTIERALSASVAPAAEQPRSPIFMFLYGFTVGAQAADVHSTRRALEAGAFETNPFMKAISTHTSRLIAIKGGMTVGTIVVTERIARHHKTTAILTLIAINSAYAYVAHHNYSVARRLR
jgi:uncharacterized protein DUF5658